jgi:TPR repeat protein
MRWYRLAAAQVDANAQCKIGFMYGNGKGVPSNYPEAMRWYKMAAEQGNASALSNLGFMFDHGHGVEQDDARALMYYNKAAKRGDVYANKNRDIIEARLVAHAARKVAG